MNSSEERVIKKIVTEQQRNIRSGTWYHAIKELLDKYGIQLTHKVKKSEWKKHVKEHIRSVMEDEIRKGCGAMSKGRSIALDEYKMKKYLQEVPVDTASSILKVRMHMSKLPCNYGNGRWCWLCDKPDVKIEHYLECPGTLMLRECMGIKDTFTCQDTHELVKISQFYQKLELRNVLYRKKNNNA